MQVERITAKGQIFPLKFMQDAVAASQTDVQLEHENAQLVTDIRLPWAGEIVGLSFDLSTAAGAGTLTIGPTIGGTEDANGQISVTTEAGGYLRIPRGTIPFNAGDELGVEITTNGSWDAVASDLVVNLWVLAHVEGI